jgi:siroheme synthase (precorrin-2 oxidase/ferrochelatase)
MNKAQRKEIDLCVDSAVSYVQFKTAKEIREEVNEMLKGQEMPTASLSEIRASLERTDKVHKLRRRKSSDSFAYTN